MEHGHPLAPAWAAALEASAWALTVRDSTWIYPLANLTHLLGLVMLVGPIASLDLRLLGVARAIAASDLSRLLTPIAVIGLVLSLASGSVLFVADAGALARNEVFLAKMALLALGALNAVAFRWLWHHRLHQWDVRPPLAGRLQALASIFIWLGTATFGRLIAYF
ncbi:DUF6644 family protein [Vineibacter terrae]|uniref:DUF6644 family protein n=1 Tax=Vineibacter terrae TaxID=2586908 RepID=UPI001C498AA9|nr:DUF6644 family protein [Vineibacter terrae]